jgi:putative PIN family toxin of toxin-antitoxin system
MRVVLDTNVLVSAALFPEGRIGRIIGLACTGSFQLVISPAILEEVGRVLSSAKIGFSATRTRESVELISDIAEVVRPRERISVIRAKESDNRILECAMEANADVIVTGDMQHLRPLKRYGVTLILTPREFTD